MAAVWSPHKALRQKGVIEFGDVKANVMITRIEQETDRIQTPDDFGFNMSFSGPTRVTLTCELCGPMEVNTLERQMALAVLAGDSVAALALADRLCEERAATR